MISFHNLIIIIMRLEVNVEWAQLKPTLIPLIASQKVSSSLSNSMLLAMEV